jgi:hypothetical protein
MFTLFNKLSNFTSHPEDIVLELCGFELEGRKKIYEVLKVSLTLQCALFRMKVFIFGSREGEVGVVLPKFKKRGVSLWQVYCPSPLMHTCNTPFWVQASRSGFACFDF